MTTLEHDRLVFRFPEVHEDACCAIDFQRTLRLPDDDREHLLPPGLGSFPLRHVDDFSHRLPPNWHDRGGVFFPIHRAEAMWVNFSADDYPFAVKVAAGKVNAVTGEPWAPQLNRDPQDYAVLPRQPWLDGFCVEKGVIRQFVAAQLGEGATAEEQITGNGEHGGLQFIVYPMKADRYEEIRRQRQQMMEDRVMYSARRSVMHGIPDLVEDMDMGMAPGGRMRQEIYEDEHGLDTWDQRHGQRCFVAMADALLWEAITDEQPPTEPPTAEDYNLAGLPWFDYYDDKAAALEGAEKLAHLKSIRDTLLKGIPRAEARVRHVGPSRRPRP
ncbi:hypothetical protein [Minwuia thermotolerans]|uniref:hypothetical protein n=1 Tax=Minwuia thermotolerans TaxID=2056226 RepID=UPI000D6DC378|nr:hypothetical protein [Minwuia thermotolerans]